MHHGSGKCLGVLLAGKVEAVDGLGVAPLVERGRRLVVLETLQNRTVDDDLVILQLAADDAERVVLLVVIDLHLAQSGRRARGNPFFLHVIVDHHRGPGADYALLTVTERNGGVGGCL